MDSPAPKRLRLTSLDDTSSSSDSDSESDSEHDYDTIFSGDGNTTQADIDQVPVFLLAGKWPLCFNEMHRDLSENRTEEFADSVMKTARALSTVPLSAETMHKAFLENCDLGVAYLILFDHAMNITKYTRECVGSAVQNLF